MNIKEQEGHIFTKESLLVLTKRFPDKGKPMNVIFSIINLTTSLYKMI